MEMPTNEYNRFASEVKVAAESVDELSQKIGNRLASSSVRSSGGLEVPLPRVRLILEDAPLEKISNLLVDFDREIRRAVRIVMTNFELVKQSVDSPEYLTLPDPIRVSQGSLFLDSAKPGTLELLFHASGEVANFLITQPLVVVQTLFIIWDHRPQRWGGRTRRRPEGPEQLTVHDRMLQVANDFVRNTPDGRAIVEFRVDVHDVIDARIVLEHDGDD